MGRTNTGGAGAAAAGLASEVIQTDSRGVDIVDAAVVLAELRAPIASAANTYRMLIDLSNAGGKYKHTKAGPARLLHVTAWLDKAKSSDSWRADLGVILAIDDTQATVGYIEAGSLRVAHSDRFVDRRTDPLYPSVVALDVAGGVFTFLATSEQETTTDLNTAGTIEDAAGDAQTPAVGDVILRARQLSGNGDAEVYYAAHYYTVDP